MSYVWFSNQAAAAAPPLDVSDNFNRADGALGANWTAVTGRSAPTILSNELSSDVGNSAYWNADVPESNQYAETSYSLTETLNTADCGPAVRVSTSAATFYTASPQEASRWDEDLQTNVHDGYKVFLYKVVSGTLTELVNSPLATASGVVRLEASGSNLKVKYAATHGGSYTTLIDVNDSAISSGRLGMSNEGGPGHGDNWYGGNL